MQEKQANRITPDEIEKYSHLFDERMKYESNNDVAYRNGELRGQKKGRYYGKIEGRLERKQEERIQIIQTMINNKIPEDIILHSGFTKEEIELVSKKD